WLFVRDQARGRTLVRLAGGDQPLDPGAHVRWLARAGKIQPHARRVVTIARSDEEDHGDMNRFEGKVAIVTGASTGLGPVMARMLAAEGAKLVLAARRAELVEEVAHQIGDGAIALKADVTSEEDVARMVDTAMQRWG